MRRLIAALILCLLNSKPGKPRARAPAVVSRPGQLVKAIRAAYSLNKDNRPRLSNICSTCTGAKAIQMEYGPLNRSRSRKPVLWDR